MTLPRYSDYKSVNVPWVGKVPRHWRVQPLMGVARERFQQNTGMLENNLLSLSYGQIVRKSIDSNDGLLPESFETYQVVYSGDIVLRLTDLQNDKRSLRSAQVQEQGIITSAYLALQPIGASSAFLAYLLRAYDFSKVFYSMGGGLRQSMKFDDLKRLPIAVPPEPEQKSIAAFLDRDTAKIDALIAEQEKLLTLLAEKRQATISRAVTLGLDPNAPMKDSGVDWLGKIPAHWDVARFKRVVLSIEQGWSPQCENFPAESAEEWGVLKVGCVNGGHFDPKENKKLPPDLAPVPEYGLKAGDLLISRANTKELVGSAAVVPFDFDRLLLCDKLYRLRLALDQCLPDYAAAVMGTREARSQIELAATGASSSMLNISQGVVLDLPLPMPPLEEQHAIVAFVRNEIGKIDTLSIGAQRGITLLKERRAALIAAAVTGQIDVRSVMQSCQPATQP